MEPKIEFFVHLTEKDLAGMYDEVSVRLKILRAVLMERLRFRVRYERSIRAQPGSDAG
jgi:hypothetical protein